MLKASVVAVLATALVLLAFAALAEGAGEMGQVFLFVLCGCVGFILGYGVRAMISLRRRREAREILEASERLRASISRTDFTAE
jgi:ABC-type spermidine/putrescine transport system permease subunit II